MAEAHTVSVLLKLKDEASRGIQQADRTMGKFAAGVQKHQAAFRATGLAITAMGAAMVGLAGVSVKAASNLEESINAVQVVFGEGSKGILEFGKNAATSVGLSAQAFNQMATITGALLKDTGISMDKVAERTNALTVRAADMASVFNTDVKDAMSAINQALRGETEAIRRYAGDVTDASLETFRLAQGINKAVGEMTEQEKRLLRIDLIMAQTAVTAGDFANTSDSLANQLRISKAVLGDVAAELGTVLLPMVADAAVRFGNMAKTVAAWTKEHPQLTKALVIAGAAIGAFMLVLGPLLIVLPGLIAALPIVAAGFTALGPAISVAFGPIGILAVAIAALTVLMLKNQDVVLEWTAKASRAYASYARLVGNDTLASQLETVAIKLEGMARESRKVQKDADALGKSLDFTSPKFAAVGNEAFKAAEKVKAFGDSAASISTQDTFAMLDTQRAESTRKASEKLNQELAALEQKRIDDKIAIARVGASAIDDMLAQELGSFTGFSKKMTDVQARFNQQQLDDQNRANAERVKAAEDADAAIVKSREAAVRSLRAAMLRQTESIQGTIQGYLDQISVAGKLDLTLDNVALGFLNATDNVEALRAAMTKLAEEGGGLTAFLKFLGLSAEESRAQVDALKRSIDTLGEDNTQDRPKGFEERAASQDRQFSAIYAAANMQAIHDKINRANYRLRQLSPDADEGIRAGLLAEVAEGQRRLDALQTAHRGGRSRGGLALVGEAGPELVNLPAGANVTANSALRGGMGGSKVLNLTLNFNAPTFDSRAAIAQAVRDIEHEGGFDDLFRDR